MAYKITLEELQTEQNKYIAAIEAELLALQKVEVNTKHKTLNNRSLTNAIIFNPSYRMSDGAKDVRINYHIKYADGHTKYEYRIIPASTFNGEVVGMIKQSRVLTPVEFKESLDIVIAYTQNALNTAKAELDTSESITANQNKLVELIEAHNKSLSYASSKARL